MAVKPIPEGYHSVIPYLIVDGAERLIEFMKQAFGATDGHPPFKGPGGKIMHAEVRVGDSAVWLSDSRPEYPPMPSMLTLFVEDVDATFKRAVEAGATPIREPANQFYGDRTGGIKDPLGNEWWITTHVEDVSPEEMERRHEELSKKMQAQS